ncbi:unnamed protein product, partial [Aphanomyces euteiches]
MPQTVKVPLPPDYFNCPPLSSQDIQQYLALGEQSVKSLLYKVNVTTGGGGRRRPYAWKLLEYAWRVGRTTFVDVVNLYTVLPRHPDRPNDCIQIKWVLTKSPLDGLVARRDFVVVESELEFQVDGKRSWVRSFHSIELDAAPDMRKELGCIRGYMHDMGFVIMESDRPGYLDMTYLVDMDVRGSVPSWVRSMTESLYTGCKPAT